MGHTQTENYDLSQPICENPQLALEALKQIIQANKDGNNETAIFMTVKQCQKCGEWPTCRLDSNSQDVAIIIECSQNTDNQWAIASESETVKDLIRTWNHLNSDPFMDPAPPCEQKNDDATTNERIKNYDWDAPITDPWLAEDVFNDCIRKQSDLGNAEMAIVRCARCGEYPVADVAVDTFVLGCPKCKRIFWARKCDSLTAVATDWNREQEIMETNKESLINTKPRENEMATTGEMIEKYDWNEPIANNRVLAADALEACIERNFPEESMFNGAYMYGIPAKMEILRHRNSGEIPKVMKAEDGSNIGIGVEGLCYVWACPSETLTTLVDTWNKLQGKDGKRDDTVKTEATSTAVDSYDWDAPIGVDDKLLADVVQHCLKQQETGNGIPKMHICLCKDCCQPPMVFNQEHQGNTFFGCDNPKHASIPINANMSLTEVVKAWNELQGVPAEKTENEPPAKTIEELEAEADRGLSKLEDVQRLKEANVLTDVQKAIAEVCDEIKELLLEKNRKYGNSAMNPCRIFARSDRLEQIRVRIDDKLNRIKNEQGDEDEDVVKDLIGYLVLYTVAQLHDFND